MARRWLITGCSSGLGRALAQAVAGAGDQAVVTARQTASLADLVEAWPGQLVPVAMDLRDAQQCEDAVKAAVERFGGIDVLVNNAGSGLFGAVEEVTDEELRDQLESVVIGPWRLVRLALPTLRAQGSGHIVNVSTTGARSPVPGLAAYLSSKAALEGMSLALANEVAALGIRVTVLEPGPFATNYGKVLAETAIKLPEYEALSGMLGLLRGLDAAPGIGRPEDFAETILRIVDTPAPTPVRIPVGPGAIEMLSEAVTAAGTELESVRALPFVA